MKKPVVGSVIAGLTVLGAAAAVYASGGSPFGQFDSFDKVEVIIEKKPIKEKGVIIDGKLYIPIEPLRQNNKLAYYLDGQTYQAHIFLGGGTASSANDENEYRSPHSNRIVEPDFMMNVAYDTRNYHAGMMRQDVINIANLAKALLDTSHTLEKVVYSKLTVNQDPDMALIRQQIVYRTAPIDIMEGRMEALANELGNQKGLGRKWERKMDDVIDDLNDAVKNKNRAVDALEDWIRSSDKDDLEDFRDYEDEARENIADAIKTLIGEDIEDSGIKYSQNLKDKIDEWTREVQS